MSGFLASSRKVYVGSKRFDIIKSFPFLAKAMYISDAGVLIDAKGVETEFYKTSESILDLLVKDLQSIFLKTGPICGENAKYITEHLTDEYKKEYNCEVKTIVMRPGAKEYRVPNFSWGITMSFIDQMRKSQEEYIKQREKVWGVGTTMGVNYHALPFFMWKDSNLYVSAETTICRGIFGGVIQLHVARSQEDMINLLKYRYGASNPRVIENNVLGETIKNLTGRNSFLEMNLPSYTFGAYKKKRHPFKSLTFNKYRKETLRGILKTLSKIPIKPRKRLTTLEMMRLTKTTNRPTFRHTLRTKLATEAKLATRTKAGTTRKIKVSDIFLTKK